MRVDAHVCRDREGERRRGRGSEREEECKECLEAVKCGEIHYQSPSSPSVRLTSTTIAIHHEQFQGNYEGRLASQRQGWRPGKLAR